MNDRIALFSHSSALVSHSSSFVCTRLSFVFDPSLLVCTGLSFVFTRLHSSVLVSHSSARVLPLICNISNNLLGVPLKNENFKNNFSLIHGVAI